MTEEVTAAEAEEGWEFALVEIMDFRKHWGRVREVERFGVKMVRVDVPLFIIDGPGLPARHAGAWETYEYASSALFGIRYTDEATVMAQNRPYSPPARVQITQREYAPYEPDDTEEAALPADSAEVGSFTMQEEFGI